jgi:exonuclease SbcC
LLPAQLLGAQQAQESKPEDGKSKDSEAVDASEADPQADSETPDKDKDKDKNAQVTDIPWQKIESALSQARKDWQSSGEVDREDVGVINQRYFDTLNPVQKAVRDNQNENASFKEGLVNKAKALLESEDVFAAINQLKDIQQRWKTIGFSGSKADGALWRKFRQANDLVFAKRDELKNQRSEQNQQQLTDFNHQLDEVEAQVLAADSLSVLNQQSASLQAVMTQLDDQDKHIQSKISPKAQALQSLINTTKKALQEVAAKQVYINAFDQFEHVSKQDAPDDQIQLSALWNDTLSGLGDDTDTSLRYDLTIGLEIAFGVGSPARDTDRRMALQMEMLSKKINHGQQKNSHNAAHDELLKGWFKVGKLKDDETELLERIKALFIE